MSKEFNPRNEQMSDHYTVISADTHAGGSHAQYREYLEAKYLEDFDAWRARYSNPFKDLGDDRRLRNWDNEMRTSQQLQDGVVGEVVFPNTIPPFFPSVVLSAPQPKPHDYQHRLAGIRAHNRWLVDFCAAYPTQRAGIGQIFANNLEDALADAAWIAENGLRGGILLPNIPPDATWIEHHLFDPYWEPLWTFCEDAGVVVNIHGGTGVPDFGKVPAAQLLFIGEFHFYSQRPFLHLLLSGVFERYPNLKFVMAEMGAFWLPSVLTRLDQALVRIRDTGQTGELRYGQESILPLTATEYFRRNCWAAVSSPKLPDVEAMQQIGLDRFMWGSDYPHDEGTAPFTREHLRQLFSGWAEPDLRRFLAGEAASVYDFDLVALEPLAEQWGPKVGEIRQPLTALPEHANEALVRGPIG
jgi:predicted TIM-barrel fold metal-dependent hydrolase